MTVTDAKGKRDRSSRPTSIRAPDTTIEALAQAAAGVPEGRGARRDHHRGHVVGDHRRRRGAWCSTRAERAAARGLTPLARIIGWAAPASIRGSWASARCRRCGSCSRGPGSTLGRFRSGRAQRSVRAAGARGLAGRADPGREAERQRRRDRARPSDRLHRRADRRHAAPRDATPRTRAAAWRRSVSAAEWAWRWRSKI